MVKGSGLALKSVQWFLRAIQFCCAAIVLGIFAYFLATLHNHGMHIKTWLRAVTGISGIAVLYTALALLLLCCLAGHVATSLFAIILDLCFIAAFIYIAVANRGGASSCKGQVKTAFGSGNANQQVSDNGHGGFTRLPSLRQACRMQTAVLAVSIVAVLFFLFSILTEIALVRHRRKEKRFGHSPANEYATRTGKKQRRGLFGRKKRNDPIEPSYQNQNALPAHTNPNDVRDSYATEQTRVGHSRGTDTAGTHNKYNKYGESGYEQPAGGFAGNGYQGNQPLAPAQNTVLPTQNTVPPTQNPTVPAQYPAGNYQYGDGVYNARA